MTPDRRARPERRANLDELEPDLRKRLLALDEPIARDDWQDVARRSRASTPLRRPRMLAVVALIAASAGAAGLFAGRQLAAPDHAAPAAGQGVDVSSGRQGGLCYRWPNGASGCAQLETTSLNVSWQQDRVLGAVSADHISSVTIEFTDGTFAKPAIFWVAAPVRAGFFVYDIPAGKIVSAIDGLYAGRVSRQVTWFSV